MPNGEDTAAVKERSDQEVLEPLPKFSRWIGINIKLVDNHYLATFNHDAPRIFHNMARLLTAIEIEAAKLGPGPTET